MTRPAYTGGVIPRNHPAHPRDPFKSCEAWAQSRSASMTEAAWKFYMLYADRAPRTGQKVWNR